MTGNPLTPKETGIGFAILFLVVAALILIANYNHARNEWASSHTKPTAQ